MATTTVTRKGQVTIPKPVRDTLGIKPGTAVEFELALEGRAVMLKIAGKRPPNRFDRLRGIAGPGLSTDELMTILRGDD